MQSHRQREESQMMKETETGITQLLIQAEELTLLNCGVGEDSSESLDCKEIQPVNSKRT